MPSSKKKNLKDIYVANSIDELIKLGDTSNVKSGNPNLLCKSADKLYTQALSFDDIYDEEKAYILYMRYMSVMTKIWKTNLYKKDKAHFDKLIGTTKPLKAMNQLEILQKSLEKRYEEKTKAKEEEELAKKVLAKRNAEEEKAKETKKPANPSFDEDDLLDGNALSSPGDIYQKLKVSHSSILTPKGSMSNGLHDDVDALIPGITNTVQHLSAEQLYSLINTTNPTDFLIFDIRPQNDYAKNHILNESCINIPAELLEHGVSVSNIERRLQERTRVIWRQRGTKTYIIIVDQSSKVTTVSPSSTIFQFKEAIYKNDSSCKLMNEPFILDGGFDDWLWHYPSMATKSELPVISSNTSLDKMIDISSLEFPELPVDTKPQPIESKPQPSPTNIETLNTHDMYPSLPNPPKNLKTNGALPGHTNGEEITRNQTPKPNHSQINEPEKKLDNVINHRPPPKVPEPGYKPDQYPGNHQHPGTIPSNEASGHHNHQLDQTTSHQFATTPRSGSGQSMTNQPQIPNNKPLPPVNQIPGSQQQPIVSPQGYQPPANQIAGLPSQPMPGQVPIPGQGLGATVSGQNQMPRQLPTTSNQLPGQTPTSVSHNHVPRQMPASNGNTQVPQFRDSRPVQPPFNNQTPVPGNFPITQGVGQKPGHPVVNGQTINPGQQTRTSVVKPASNQEDTKPVVPPLEIKPAGYITTKGLPPGWEKCVDSAMRVFYKDHNTHTTQWTPPVINTTPTIPTPQLQNKPTNQENIPVIPPHTPKQQQQFPRQLGSTPGQTNKLKSNLRRSLSSPNLANLDDDGDNNDNKVNPLINRSLKPNKPSFNRNAKPITTQKIDSLNPVHGGIGRGLTGLRNLGNTCYMNSVLQCLFNTAPLVQYFVSGAFREDLNTTNPLGTRGALAEQFSFLLRVAISGQYKSLSPVEFKKTVGKVKSSFSGFDQQDSQEFLALMMDKLHEDVNTVLKKPYLEAPGDNIEPRRAAEISWENHKKRNQSFLLELFDGLFMSTVRCLVCRKESVTFETFSNLTLPIPAHNSHCSLKDCINLFTRPEKMSGDDKWYCPQCKQHREASKQLQIWKLPKILVIHLKRFQYDGMWRQKLQTNVSFPLVDLDMSAYVTGPNRQSPYTLYGVSNHYGTMHGGHYTAFCRNPHDKQWYKFDDQLVSKISSSSSIVTYAGYLLFYTSFQFLPPKLF